MFYLSGTLFRGLLGRREAIAPLCFESREDWGKKAKKNIKGDVNNVANSQQCHLVSPSALSSLHTARVREAGIMHISKMETYMISG